MKRQRNLLPAPLKHPNNQQGVKEEEEEAQEEEEDEVEEAEVPAPEKPKDLSYQETLKMEITQIISKLQMVNCKDQYMDTHFAIIAEGLVIKDNIAQ